MDTVQIIVTVVVAVIGSTGLSQLVQFLIKRHDDRRNSKEAQAAQRKKVLDDFRAEVTADFEAKLDQKFDTLSVQLGDQFKTISTNFEKMRLKNCQTQLMSLINFYPHNAADIYKLAEYYFVTLHGDSFLSTIFKDWVASQGDQLPSWFVDDTKKQ